MKKLQALIILTCFWPQPEALACRPPDYADIEITRNLNSQNSQLSTAAIIFNFRWDEQGGDLNCEPGTAIEFEVLIDTDPVQKCFAQPPGGRDERKEVIDLKFDGYTDVWNYYFEYRDTDEVHEILLDQCGEDIDRSWARKVIWADKLIGIDDEVANFGFGTLDPDQFQLGNIYEVTYLLEIPNRPECDDIQSGWGHVQINMAVIQNTCMLDGVEHSCPHLIGYQDCENFDIELQKRYTLQHRLCAPTGGVWQINRPCADEISRWGGQCVDYDGDGYYANVPQIGMFGHLINDCNDNIALMGMSTLEGDTGPTTFELIYPEEQLPVFHDTLAAAISVQDPDGIKQFTITIDEIQRPECKVKKFVSLRQDPTDYVLTMDLKACLGNDYGLHKFKIWVVDRCDNRNTEIAPEYEFRYEAGGDNCSHVPTGEILSADTDGEIEYAVTDYDGLVFTTLNINNIDEDRCKFRRAVHKDGAFKISVIEEDREVPLGQCLKMYGDRDEWETLDSVQLWAVDECGNIEFVNSYQVPTP